MILHTQHCRCQIDHTKSLVDHLIDVDLIIFLSIRIQRRITVIDSVNGLAGQNDVQKMTDEFIKKIDVMIEDKSKEIMTV